MELRPFDSVTLTQQLAAKLMGVEKISEVCLAQCFCFNAILMLISTKKSFVLERELRKNCIRNRKAIRTCASRWCKVSSRCLALLLIPKAKYRLFFIFIHLNEILTNVIFF